MNAFEKESRLCLFFITGTTKPFLPNIFQHNGMIKVNANEHSRQKVNANEHSRQKVNANEHSRQKVNANENSLHQAINAKHFCQGFKNLTASLIKSFVSWRPGILS
ncbi:MAG: hypothetical protein JXR70_01345 [Spirochaetales bacterium]|nr:hypothetical protein [Spirochaetales bacterium]